MPQSRSPSKSPSMSLSRRKTLALIGGGVVLAAGAPAAGFLASRTPDRALEPWAAAGSYGDARLDALSFALLAPNPHNLQPWQAELVGPDAVLIHRDPALRLEHTDPFDRQITIGLGCFLELMTIAASARGQAVALTLFPDGEDGPIAHARFRSGAAPDPLAGAILHRRTCRDAYDDRPVPAGAVAALADHAMIVTDAARVATLRRLTRAAMRVEMETERTRMESVHLMRFGKAEIEANPDGIALGGPMLESLMLVGALTRDQQADPASASFRQGLDMLLTNLDATPAYAVIASDGNSRADQIAAGGRWLRLNLAATGRGLSLQPVSQALQEYPEMAALYGQAHDLLAMPGQTVQMLGRLGYGPRTPPAPRWPLETRLRQT